MNSNFIIFFYTCGRSSSQKRSSPIPPPPVPRLVSTRRVGKCLNLQHDAPSMSHKMMNLSGMSSFLDLHLEHVQSVGIFDLQNIPLDVDYLGIDTGSNPQLSTHDII